MLLMESYLYYCSIRLGVMIISFFALIKSFVLIYILFTDRLGSLVKLFKSDMHIMNNDLVKETLLYVQLWSNHLAVLGKIYNILHIFTCFYAVYGAYKLKKWYVLPLAIFELFYVVEVIMTLAVYLKIIKQIVDLSVLILTSIICSFYILLVAYDFLVLVAFMQIVTLVQSERYRLFYGSDPFNPYWTEYSLAMFEKSKQASAIYFTPKLELSQPKWWQVQSSYQNNVELVDAKESNKYFQEQELVTGILLRNALKAGFKYKPSLEQNRE